MDIAIPNYIETRIDIFMGSKNTTFQYVNLYLFGRTPICINTADFNNDGKLDLAVASDLYNMFDIFLNTGISNGTDNSGHSNSAALINTSIFVHVLYILFCLFVKLSTE